MGMVILTDGCMIKKMINKISNVNAPFITFNYTKVFLFKDYRMLKP